jgi:hypothetical protein
MSVSKKGKSSHDPEFPWQDPDWLPKAMAGSKERAAKSATYFERVRAFADAGFAVPQSPTFLDFLYKVAGLDPEEEISDLLYQQLAAILAPRTGAKYCKVKLAGMFEGRKQPVLLQWGCDTATQLRFLSSAWTYARIELVSLEFNHFTEAGPDNSLEWPCDIIPCDWSALASDDEAEARLLQFL